MSPVDFRGFTPAGLELLRRVLAEAKLQAQVKR